MSELKKTFRCGQITASVWVRYEELNRETVARHTIKIEKSYKKENKWVNTNNFFIQELPKVSLVAQEAYKYLNLKNEELQNNNNQENKDNS